MFSPRRRGNANRIFYTGDSEHRSGPELGVLEWFRPGEHERVERVLGELRALGVRRLRTGVSWADWHAAGGEEWYGWLLPRLASEVELLPCVVYTPPSLAVAPRIQAPPRRTRDYADFLDVLLTRHGEHFEHVELWNEPNNLNDWDWTLDPGWELFARMVGEAAYWVRERGWKPVLGGMCPTDPDWLRIMGEHGVLEVVDAVGLHAFPGSWDTVWDGWERTVERVRAVLDRHAPETEVWVTEVGFSTWRNDELGQLQVLLEALEAPVPRVYWYAAEDLDEGEAACDGFHVDVRHYHFGLHRSNGRPKLLARVWGERGAGAVEEVVHAARPARNASREPCTLVTGGAGFVGTNLADRLLAEGRRVRVLDALARPGSERNLMGLRERHGERLEIQVADVRDPLALGRALEDAEAVFHLAAQVAVTTSLADPVGDFAANVEGTVRLLDAVRRLPEPPFFLFTSTNKVYGRLGDVELGVAGGRWEPLDETLRARGVSECTPLDFCTPYGCSKGAADQYVLDAAASFGVPAAVFRMSCIYGPHQHGNEDQGWVAHFLRRALAGEQITVFGDGAQVRDLLFVDDLVEAMLRCRDAGLTARAFNLGGGPDNAVSLLELLDLVGGLTGRHPGIRFAAERRGDQRWYVSDTAAFRAAAGWRPRTGVEEGLAALHAWLAGRSRSEVAA